MPRALSKLIEPVARRVAGKDWNLYASLLEHWQEIVGHDYARVTTPVKVTFPHQPLEAHRKNGTLCIRLPKGLAMEFGFKTDLIKQRVNTYFGYAAIERITFEPVYEVTPEPQDKSIEVDPVALAKISEISGPIEDDALRQALENFGHSILKSQNRTP